MSTSDQQTTAPVKDVLFSTAPTGTINADTTSDSPGVAGEVYNFLKPQTPDGPNCTIFGSAKIVPGDTCPGLCYSSFSDDEEWEWSLAVLAIMVLYNAWYFLYKRRGKGLFSNVAAQWAETIITSRPQDPKQPVTAIQSMRCSLQATQAFSAVSGVIASYCLLVEESDHHNRVVYLYMAIMNWLACIFFAEQMRCLYHLAYCVVRTAPLNPNVIPPEFLQLLSDLRSGHISESDVRQEWSRRSRIEKKNSNNRALHEYLNNEERAPYLFLSGGGDDTIAGGNDSEVAYQLALETFMPPVDEAERVKLLIDRSFTYFSLGQRAFLGGIPIMFGLIHDYWMGLATLCLICFHIFYYDDLLDANGGTWENMSCVKFYQRFKYSRHNGGDIDNRGEGGCGAPNTNAAVAPEDSENKKSSTQPLQGTQHGGRGATEVDYDETAPVPATAINSGTVVPLPSEGEKDPLEVDE